jgi:hypothetical protein
MIGFGRELVARLRDGPAADGLERVLWGLLLAGSVTILGLALWLEPDPRGVGTHEQLGLAPCGLVQLCGLPCPSCGFTTTFSLAAHGRWWAAFVNQPFGFVLFVATLASIPVSWLACWRGFSLLALIDRWPWGRVLGAAIAGWLAGWAYKISSI